MTVSRNSNQANDHAVGLVAVSSLQGWRHLGGQQSDGPVEGQGATALGRLWSTFNLTSPKQCLGYTINGHVAMLARVAGQVRHVVGFNPSSYLQTGLYTMIWSNRRFTVDGLWYDDSPMLDDPTAISFEINAERDRVEEFGQAIAGLVGGDSVAGLQYKYTFLPGTLSSNVEMRANCSDVATHVLCAFLTEWGGNYGKYVDTLREWVNTDERTRNFAQGKLMASMQKGFGK